MKLMCVELMCWLISAACLCASAEEVAEGGGIEVMTTFQFINANHDYVRTCRHELNGELSVEIIEKPIPRNEFELIGSASYEWTISPAPIGEVSGARSSDFVLAFDPQDAGKSFSVSVTVTWLLRNGGEIRKYEIKKTLVLQVVVYSIRAESVEGTGAGRLIDSHPGMLIIDVLPQSSRDDWDFSLEEQPVSLLCQNHVGNFTFGFAETKSPLIWEIRHPYWYGGNLPPSCCYTNIAEYVVNLGADLCRLCTANNVQVSLPSDDLNSSANLKVVSASIEEVGREFVSETSKWRLTYRFSDFGRLSAAITASTSQYHDLILQEEETHAKQLKKEIPSLMDDAFSIAEICRNNDISIGSGELEFDTQLEIVAFLDGVRSQILREKELSGRYWRQNMGYIESFAKNRVGFREAYKYHCTYHGVPTDWISKETVKTNGYQIAEDEHDSWGVEIK